MNGSIKFVRPQDKDTQPGYAPQVTWQGIFDVVVPNVKDLQTFAIA